jgi:hypothetical protein
MKRRKVESEKIRALQALHTVRNTDMTVAKYADVTGYPESEIRQALRDGRIPERRIGSRVFVRSTREVYEHIRSCLSDPDRYLENEWLKHPAISRPNVDATS